MFKIVSTFHCEKGTAYIIDDGASIILKYAPAPGGVDKAIGLTCCKKLPTDRENSVQILIELIEKYVALIELSTPDTSSGVEAEP